MNEGGGPGRPARPRWHRIGYALTLAWIVAVMAVTGGDPAHPLYDLIFTVPLAAWIVAIIIDRVARRRHARRGPSTEP